MSCNTSLHLGYQITHYLIRSCIHLSIALVAGFLTVTITLAQPTTETAFQNNQIGMNSFVSGSNGSIYLIIGDKLYRNSTGEADTWDRIAENVLSMAVDPKDDNVVYAITTKPYINESVMIKSLDGGKTWISLRVPTCKLENFVKVYWQTLVIVHKPRKFARNFRCDRNWVDQNIRRRFHLARHFAH